MAPPSMLASRRTVGFLEAELLYKPLCPSVGLLVGWLVGVQLAFGPFLAKTTGHILIKIDTHGLLIY